MAAVSEQSKSGQRVERHRSSSDSDQPVEIHQLSSDSESQESQRPSSSERHYVRHKVFLSHSGAQKPFVQELLADLKAENHCPFYDGDESSLPKGEDFVPRIFKAARHCRLAVVVLSEELLTSKWPMIELVEFVKARKNGNKGLKLLPLFYGLSVAETGDETNQRRWRAAWETFARPNDSESVQSMIEAFGELRRVNGLEFVRFESEKAYREAVVKTILGLSPSDLRFDTSKWEGCDRLCKVLSRMFRADTGSSGVQKLGLFGMGGVGKTTVSKALCNFFQQDYFGRVCHVELGSEKALVLQKKVLKELARLPEAELHQIVNCDQGSTRLKECLHQHPVFLVIDNVSDDQASRREALAYLEAGFHEGSKIMVTARSQDVVKGVLLLDPKYCKPMPNLMKDEAAVIFLWIAAPGRKVSSLSPEEQCVLNSCLDECYFDNFDRAQSSRKRKRHRRHYHPLALGALGAYFNTINDTELLAWEPRLGDYNKWKNTSAQGLPEIFQILGLQFSTFEEPTKIMFLDIALSFQNLTHIRLATPQRRITWLAKMHDMSEAEVELKMNQLKRSAMISIGETAITTHDLYKEYADWYVSTRGLAMSDVRFVYQTLPNQNKGLPRQLQRHPPGKCWPDLSRILLRHLNCNEIPRRNLREWCNVVVLLLRDCSKVAVLNLYGLNCLRHLEISGLPKLETLIFTKVVCSDPATLERQHSVCSLVSLKLVVLDDLPVLKRLPNFSPCLQLKELRISKCSTKVAASPCCCQTARDRPELICDPKIGRILFRACLVDDSPSIPSCESLQTLNMQWSCHYAPKMVFTSTLTSLRELSIWVFDESFRGIVFYTQLLGLEHLSSLEEICLVGLTTMRMLPGLERLTNLHSITLLDTHSVEELPHLGRLSRLRHLRLRALARLDQIHGLDRLMHLEYLDLRDCYRLLCGITDLRPLKSLQVVVLNGCDALEGVPPRTPKGCFVWMGPPPELAFRPLRRHLM